MVAAFNECYFIRLRGTKKGQEGALYGIWRSCQCPQVKGRGRVEELKKRGTRGTREAEQEHMRGTTEGQNMYSRSTLGMSIRGPIPN